MIVDINNIGKRIDKYLCDNTEYTRSKIQKMIETGNILVNGNKVKDSYKVKENDNIEITELIEETDILPENIPLDIYYEDDDYYYLDPMETDYTTGELKLTAGTYLLKEDSSDKFAVGQKGSLQGVYNINKGYTQFRQISILAQNEEYTLVEEGTSYGLTVYDRIVQIGRAHV